MTGWTDTGSGFVGSSLFGFPSLLVAFLAAIIFLPLMGTAHWPKYPYKQNRGGLSSRMRPHGIGCPEIEAGPATPSAVRKYAVGNRLCEIGFDPASKGQDIRSVRAEQDVVFVYGAFEWSLLVGTLKMTNDFVPFRLSSMYFVSGSPFVFPE